MSAKTMTITVELPDMSPVPTDRIPATLESHMEIALAHAECDGTSSADVYINAVTQSDHRTNYQFVCDWCDAKSPLVAAEDLATALIGTLHHRKVVEIKPTPETRVVFMMQWAKPQLVIGVEDVRRLEARTRRSIEMERDAEATLAAVITEFREALTTARREKSETNGEEMLHTLLGDSSRCPQDKLFQHRLFRACIAEVLK